VRAALLRSGAAAAALAVAALPTIGCGDRPAIYDDENLVVRAVGMDSQVALVDDGAHRVVLLRPGADRSLTRISVPIGERVVRAEVSTDGKRLFVLSAGDLTRRKASDERPSLTVIEGRESRRYPLESAHSGLSIDPEGRWVALSAAPASAGGGVLGGGLVENPNEIVLVDLAAPIETAVTPRTIRSFGGLPQRVTFTPRIGLPAGPRRLLVVESDQDLSLLDLDNVRAVPQRPEITVRLSGGGSAVAHRPGGVVVDDGDPARGDDARLGLRLDDSPSVVTLTLGPTPPGTVTEDPGQIPNDFAPLVNLADVGGIPGDIRFVRTDVGLRLLALVPSTRTAVLVDPDTSVASTVDLPEPYAKISLVTSVVGAGTGGTDTTLLYGGAGGQASRGVAFWSLGRATGKPYRSVDVVSLQASIGGVVDVPPPRPQLKVLQATGANSFYVLDLARRTASPLLTQGAASLVVSRDGERLWAFVPNTTQLARVALGDLHPVPLPLDRPIAAVFDVLTEGGGRTLVAMDSRGAGGVTLLDALAPDTAAARSYYGLLLEDL